MILERSHRLPTNDAPAGALSGVAQLVRCEGNRSAEALPTNDAHVHLDSRVHLLVFYNSAFLIEALPARSADVGFLPGVN